MYTPHDCVQGFRANARPPIANATSITSAARPIRVWYDATDPNSIEIAPLVIEVLELAWQVQVDELGFRAPFLPDAADGPEFDVYLADYQPYAAFVAGDDYLDPIQGDGYNTASAFMVVDQGLPAVAVPSYLSHEFNHVCQYATDFSEPSLPIWEGTATAAQQWTVGADGYWQIDVPSFQEVPFAPVLTGDGYRLYPPTGLGYTYEYGSAFWVMFLDQKFGTGIGSEGVALWEAAANEGFGFEPDAVDAFGAVAGTSVGEALNTFAIVRFLTGADWDPRGLAEAESWAPKFAVPAYPLAGADLPLVGFGPDPRPMITGQEFVDVDLAAGIPAAVGFGEPWIEVTVTSTSGLETGLVAMPWTATGPGDALTAIGPSPTIALPADGLTRLVVATTNLGPADWDGDDDAYVNGDQILGIVVVDRTVVPTTPTSTTTPGTTTDPGGPAADPGVEPQAEEGCGCATGPSLPGALVLVLLCVRVRAVAPTGDSRSGRRTAA